MAKKGVADPETHEQELFHARRTSEKGYVDGILATVTAAEGQTESIHRYCCSVTALESHPLKVCVRGHRSATF